LSKLYTDELDDFKNTQSIISMLIK